MSEKFTSCNQDAELALSFLSYAWELYARNHNDNPFSNTGYRYDGKKFSAHAYSWDDEEQDFNFKWRDIKVRWYKYLGRCTEINRKMSVEEAREMAAECFEEIRNL
jgi:hypothetical protein